MMDVEYTNADITFDRWSSLPEELSNPSFFFTSAEHTLILDLFVDAGSEETLEKLLSSALLSKSPISLPSLFARVWISISYSSRARVTALDRFRQHISEKSSSDFQGFVPHLIAALSDYSKEIRDAAAEAFVVLNEIYSSSTKHSARGLMELYPEDPVTTSVLKWLSLPEAKWLVNSIVSKLPECRLDCNHIVRLLGGVLNSAGKKEKKQQYKLLLYLLI
jgi:hypothetical protein